MKSFDIDKYNYRECEVHNHGFYLGEQSKQAEVDELQKNFNNALKTIEIQQRFLDDADGANKILTSQVSELQKKYDAMYNAFVVADDCRKEWHRCYVGIRQREDELRKRIDDIVKWVECNKASIPLSEWHGYTTEEYVDADDLLDILKGDNHE